MGTDIKEFLKQFAAVRTTHCCAVNGLPKINGMLHVQTFTVRLNNHRKELVRVGWICSHCLAQGIKIS